LSSAREQRDWTVSKEDNPNREKARATRARQRAIGRELRRMYDDIAQEPVPDDFLDILKKIDEADAKNPTSSNLDTVIIRASSHASFKRRTVLHNRRWVCSEMDRLIFGSSCSPTNHLPSVAWSARRRFY